MESLKIIKLPVTTSTGPIGQTLDALVDDLVNSMQHLQEIRSRLATEKLLLKEKQKESAQLKRRMACLPPNILEKLLQHFSNLANSSTAAQDYCVVMAQDAAKIDQAFVLLDDLQKANRRIEKLQLQIEQLKTQTGRHSSFNANEKSSKKRRLEREHREEIKETLLQTTDKWRDAAVEAARGNIERHRTSIMLRLMEQECEKLKVDDE